MLTLGDINHPNPTVDKKVKYFHDCFHYWLLEGTKKVDWFPENHLTYLERMMFRGQVLHQMHQSSRMSICAWLRQPEFDTENDFFAQKEHRKGLIAKLKQLATKTGKDFDLQLFRRLVQDLINEMNGEAGLDGSNYFHEVLKSVVSCLGCSHDLDEHRSEIALHTKWLVAEFLRLGFDPKDLGSSNGVFKRILAFGELKTSKKPHTVQFPLPPDLKAKSHSPSFKKAIKEYTSQNSFLKQFEGMLHALQETQAGEMLIRIDDVHVTTSSAFYFEYNGVKFFTPDQVKVDKARWNEHLVQKFEEYLGEKNSIIARVPLQFKSQEQARIKAIYLTNQALEALRYVLNDKGGVVVKTPAIILFPKGGVSINYSIGEYITIRNHDIENLQDFNHTIPAPDKITSEIKNQLEHSNRIFFKGLSCEDPDDMISNFWQYWELNFSFGKYKDSKKGEKIIADLSKVLSKGMHESNRTRLGLVIYNYAMNNLGEITGLPSQFYGREFNWKEPEITINEIASYTQYPFLLDLINRFRELTTSGEERRWHAFYTDFFWQLFEQRNLISHQGTYCPATLERLQFFFRPIVTHWQSILYNELERKPYASVEEAIEYLVNASITSPPPTPPQQHKTAAKAP